MMPVVKLVDVLTHSDVVIVPRHPALEEKPQAVEGTAVTDLGLPEGCKVVWVV